ncbi:hypothetical protein HaLaN_00619 [Haematococcus lacustris]|uniref:Uncharacterized protein n=1 Tax=Haematococcus lacustris TaxID=44745 RepID=A0A699Y9N7_HAELA|nr:hypothetical protein HaLaN_00619 [Haematococcus lacustris]
MFNHLSVVLNAGVKRQRCSAVQTKQYSPEATPDMGSCLSRAEEPESVSASVKLPDNTAKKTSASRPGTPVKNVDCEAVTSVQPVKDKEPLDVQPCIEEAPASNGIDADEVVVALSLPASPAKCEPVAVSQACAAPEPAPLAVEAAAVAIHDPLISSNAASDAVAAEAVPAIEAASATTEQFSTIPVVPPSPATLSEPEPDLPATPAPSVHTSDVSGVPNADPGSKDKPEAASSKAQTSPPEQHTAAPSIIEAKPPAAADNKKNTPVSRAPFNTTPAKTWESATAPATPVSAPAHAPSVKAAADSSVTPSPQKTTTPVQPSSLYRPPRPSPAPKPAARPVFQPGSRFNFRIDGTMTPRTQTIVSFLPPSHVPTKKVVAPINHAAAYAASLLSLSVAGGEAGADKAAKKKTKPKPKYKKTGTGKKRIN